MKRFLLMGLPLLLAATPAFATGGFECRTADGSNIVMSGAIGHVITAPLVTAHLQIGARRLSTVALDGHEAALAIGRSWIDEREIRVDLVDPQVMRFEARLRARLNRDGATGTLVRDEVSHPVRCTVE